MHARVVAISWLLVTASLATNAVSEGVYFEHAQKKGAWFVWRSAHRSLAVAWKSPFRMVTGPKEVDNATQSRITFNDDARLLSVAVVVRRTGASDIDTVLKGVAPSEADRIGDADFSDLQFRYVRIRSQGESTEWLMAKQDGGTMTLLSISSARDPQRDLSVLLAELKDWFRVNITQPAATGRVIPEGGNSPTDDDWRSAEAVAKRFLTGALSKDKAGIEETSLAWPGLEILWSGPRPPAEVRAEMAAQLGSMTFRRLAAGERIQLPNGRAETVSANRVNRQNVQVVASVGGVPMPTPLSLINVNGEWRADARPMIAAQRAARGLR
ncbi:MAG: hypothetical protein AAGJ46_21380 [Planctomycetota bacterium]